MPKPGETGYCSERCLHWDFFGVPELRKGHFLREMRHNQQLEQIPDGWAPPPAYPEFSEGFCRSVTNALAELKDACNLFKAHA